MTTHCIRASVFDMNNLLHCLLVDDNRIFVVDHIEALRSKLRCELKQRHHWHYRPITQPDCIIGHQTHTLVYDKSITQADMIQQIEIRALYNSLFYSGMPTELCAGFVATRITSDEYLSTHAKHMLLLRGHW